MTTKTDPISVREADAPDVFPGSGLVAIPVSLGIWLLGCQVAAWTLAAYFGLALPWVAVAGLTGAARLLVNRQLRAARYDALSLAIARVGYGLLLWLVLWALAPEVPIDVPSILSAWWGGA